jgi:hypothetical protein
MKDHHHYSPITYSGTEWRFSSLKGYKASKSQLLGEIQIL